MRALSSVLFSLFILNCSTSPNMDCQEADWFELGRREGARGQTFKLANSELPVLCPSSNKEEQKKMFVMGRNVGLVEFCQIGNAFELGKEGKNYENVCPEETHYRFLEYFRYGNRVRELQMVNKDIENKLIILSEKLKRKSTTAKMQVEFEILKLKNLKSKNQQQLETIKETLNL